MATTNEILSDLARAAERASQIGRSEPTSAQLAYLASLLAKAGMTAADIDCEPTNSSAVLTARQASAHINRLLGKTPEPKAPPAPRKRTPFVPVAKPVAAPNPNAATAADILPEEVAAYREIITLTNKTERARRQTALRDAARARLQALRPEIDLATVGDAIRAAATSEA